MQISVLLWVVQSPSVSILSRIEANRKTWFLGYVTDMDRIDDDVIVVDHLERVNHVSNNEWKFPLKEDECEVHVDQVIGIKPDYEWDYSNIRINRLKLKNHAEINEAVVKAKLTNHNEY